MKPPTVTLRGLLIPVPAPATSGRGAQPQMFSPALDEAAKEKAQALRDRAAKGEDFQKLVTEASESQSKANGGLVGPINLSDMSTGIRDAIEKLKPGEVTAPIRTTRGYQIFQLESR